MRMPHPDDDWWHTPGGPGKFKKDRERKRQKDRERKQSDTGTQKQERQSSPSSDETEHCPFKELTISESAKGLSTSEAT